MSGRRGLRVAHVGEPKPSHPAYQRQPCQNYQPTVDDEGASRPMTYLLNRRVPARPTAPAKTSGSGQASGSGQPYIHQMDLLRVCTFLLVIFAHAISTSNATESVATNGIGLILHFTRNSFFALTGFVLMYQYFHRDDFTARKFWPRRLKPVLFPYLIWSFVYWLYTMWTDHKLDAIPTNLGDFARLTAWGMSGFQMYFLFVMLQVYLLFPALVALVRRTRGHHLALLAGSFVTQAITLILMLQWQQPDWLSKYSWHVYATFLPYQFFIVLGALAAVHRDRVEQWVRGKGPWIGVAAITLGVIELVLYLQRIARGDPPVDAASAFHVTLLPFLVVAIAALYTVTLAWADRRDPQSRFSRVVAYGSNRSFGVFLSHVLILQLLLQYSPTEAVPGALARHLGPQWTTAISYVATVALTLLLVEVLRRLPLSRYTTGRERIPLPRKQNHPARTGSRPAGEKVS